MFTWLLSIIETDVYHMFTFSFKRIYVTLEVVFIYDHSDIVFNILFSVGYILTG